MSKEATPYLYFPSKLILIDDNHSFLENLSFELSHDFRPYIFSDPTDALDEIKNSKSLYDVAQPFLKVINNSEIDEDGESYSMDYMQIINFALKDNLKNEISVLIVDYSMPDMNGIDFCKLLKGIKAKKIMLTGEATYSVAIDAFNEGIIDKFIVKDTDTYLEELFNAIKSMENQYFNSLSDKLYINKYDLIGCSNYLEIFHEWKITNSIVEYYIVSKKGCVLGIDEKHKCYWILINTSDENEMYMSIAKESHSSKTISQIHTDEKQVYLLTNENKLDSADNWYNFIFPISSRINYNNKEYCFSFIEGDPFNL